MMAAITASDGGERVLLLEKNEKTGKKLYITGKGRCNLTNTAEGEDFFRNVVRNPKFLSSSFYGFSNRALMDFFTDAGVKLTEERGGRVFPASEKSADITDALRAALKRKRVEVICDSAVTDVAYTDGKGFRVACGAKTYNADKVIIACGGLSYPLTGSTGDGYSLARKFGHTIVDTVPGLTGIRCNSPSALSGLALKNVTVSVSSNGKTLCSEFGEMLFTHTGVSGPTILTLSSLINRRAGEKLTLSIDLKPALDGSVLNDRLVREFGSNANKQLVNALYALTPKSLAPELAAHAGISPEKTVNQITKAERQALVDTFKGLNYSITGLEPIDGAVITSGGVSVKEINPRTMESRLCKGLYFAGEVIDVDAFTGGFNLQIAFSTGYAAGRACCEN